MARSLFGSLTDYKDILKISEHQAMIATALSIRNYVSSDQPYFEALNREWIELLFEMEAVDIQILRHPEEYIITKGGCLLTATYNDRVVGTVALKLVSRGRYELTKLAVDKEFRGQRIGRALVEAAIDKAKMLRADAIVLYSVRNLKPAITLYRKLGFIEVPVDPLYKRSDIKMELKLNHTIMNRLKWFERSFAFGQPAAMLPMFLERMDGTLFRIQGKLRNIPDEIMHSQLDGKWSIKQNIGHLAEVEEISLRRVREILNGISPMSPAVFEPTLDYNAMTLDELVLKLSTVRRKNMAQYPGLSDDDLSKTSLHPRLKVNMNPVDLALFHAEHDDHHLVRINEILAHFNYPTPYVSSKLTQDH